MSKLVKMKTSNDDDGSIELHNIATPSKDADAVNKKYVDDQIILQINTYITRSLQGAY